MAIWTLCLIIPKHHRVERLKGPKGPRKGPRGTSVRAMTTLQNEDPAGCHTTGAAAIALRVFRVGDPQRVLANELEHQRGCLAAAMRVHEKDVAIDALDGVGERLARLRLSAVDAQRAFIRMAGETIGAQAIPGNSVTAWRQ